MSVGRRRFKFGEFNKNKLQTENDMLDSKVSNHRKQNALLSSESILQCQKGWNVYESDETSK